MRRRSGDAPRPNQIRTVGIIGGGQMGSGIAQVCCVAGFPTLVYEQTEAMAQRARSTVKRGMNVAVERGKLEQTAHVAACERVTVTTQLQALAGVDLIIEAVVEDLAIKNGVWRELDERCPPETIFASNTSSLTIAAMAAATTRSARVIGLHFFNPVPVMRLVEVVRAVQTSDESVALVTAFARKLGKEPIAAKDRPGFVVNRLLVPYLLDAVRALETGVATVHDIDLGMRLGAGHPMGPFALLDLVGLDTLLRMADIMYEEYRDPRFAPPPLLRRMVVAGFYGQKSGKGFWDYSQDPPRASEIG